MQRQPDDSNLLQARHAANTSALTVLHTQAQVGSTDVRNSNIILVPIGAVTAMLKSIQPTAVDAHLSLDRSLSHSSSEAPQRPEAMTVGSEHQYTNVTW